MIKNRKISNWDDLPVVLDLKTVSLIFGVAEITIRRWLSNNQIQGEKIGRKWLFEKEYIKSIVENNDRFE